MATSTETLSTNSMSSLSMISDGGSSYSNSSQSHSQSQSQSVCHQNNINNESIDNHLNNQHIVDQEEWSQSVEPIRYISQQERMLLERIQEEKVILQSELVKYKEELKGINLEIEGMCEFMEEEERAERQRKEDLKTCVAKFNEKPKHGIDYAVNKNILHSNPEEIAIFLFSQKRLSRVSVGDYIGEPWEFNIQVMNKFVGLHNFSNKNLVEALRIFLSSFHLPGEAPKIDRLMEAFSNQYCVNNTDTFKHPDTCYVLSFAVIMLNTSLHNPSIKEKDRITKDAFINMNRGINQGENLPKEMLLTLYDEIKVNQFQIPGGSTTMIETFFQPDKTGYLIKEGGKHKSKHERWFILNDSNLYYFKKNTDSNLIGSIPLENLLIRDTSVAGKKHFSFEIFKEQGIIKAWKKDSEGRPVPGNHSIYKLEVKTASEKDEWIKAIQASISRDPFYEVLSSRKNQALGVNKRETIKVNQATSSPRISRTADSKLNKHH